jgi:flagellar motility protein MotE (MotC chaperone)
MLRRSVVWLVAFALIVTGAWWVQQAISEDAGGPPGPPNPEEWRQRMEQFRQRMTDQMKQDLGVNDEEWKVLQPRIEKVQTLAMQSRGGMRGMSGRRGGRPGEGPGDRPQGDRPKGDRPEGDRPKADRPEGDRPQSEVEKKATELRTVLENKEAKPEEIKTALTALREARAKARQELETAQKELREVVSVRQEAVFVTMGLLD